MSANLEAFLAGQPGGQNADVKEARGGQGAATAFLEHARAALAAKNAALSPARRKCNALLQKSIKLFGKEKYRDAALTALDATRADPTAAQAFHMLALSLERLGHLHKAFEMYERSFKLDPTDADLYLNLGLAAWKLDLLDGAERVFRLCIERRPDAPQGYNNLGAVLRDKGKFAEAIDVLQAAITRMPDKAILWNTVGTVLGEQGDFEQSQIFYREALRLDPKFGRALHNIGFALSHTGDLDGALENYRQALPLAETELDRFEIHHAMSMCLAGTGELAKSWPLYETRHEPLFRTSILFALKAPMWRGEDVTGKKMLLVGEQGLGDEIMFAGLVPDMAERVGPNGNLMIASDPRLVPLFKRSFPGVECRGYANTRHNAKGVRLVPWAAGAHAPDVFAPMGTPLQYLRSDVRDFDGQTAFLKPDPERVAPWREKLAASGRPVVGICWRSMLMSTDRKKYYSPLDVWAKALKGQDVTLVSLQYGDCKSDLAYARESLGLEIVEIEGLDLKNDLDGAAALSAACDLVVSAPTAAAALAAATGAETWFVVAGRVWPQLGTDHYPWYPKTRAFWPERFGDWTSVMAQVEKALRERTAARAAA